MLFYLFLLFLVVPVIELSLLITVGSKIGVSATIALVFVTALLGSYFVRQQGLKTFFTIQNDLGQGKIPARALFDGVLIAGAGLLLLTPGIMTDFVGFSLLFPPFRTLFAKALERRFKHHIKVGAMNPMSAFQTFTQASADNADGFIKADQADGYIEAAPPPEARPGYQAGEIIIEATDVRPADDEPAQS